jgi:curved DNA-binding protein CbpA
MYLQPETTLLAACRTLFGHEVSLNQDFLDYLQPSGAKSAFRSLAKAHHPDGFAQSSAQVRSRQADRFREIRQAYDLIIDFLENRHQVEPFLPHYKTSQASKRRNWSASRHRQSEKPHCRSAVIPSIPLEFGMFSYYQGKVTYQQLIEALVWQRRQRPTLGAIALDWGWLSEARVSQILGHRGHAVRFGKKAVELGYLRPQQVDALLRQQRSLQRKIGQYFIEKGLITEEEAYQIAKSLEHHNSQISRRATNRSGSGP